MQRDNASSHSTEGRKGSADMHRHTASSGSDRLRLASFTEDEPMNEELSEDGYRAEAAFEGPAAWTDVDQEEVCRKKAGSLGCRSPCAFPIADAARLYLQSSAACKGGRATLVRWSGSARPAC